MLGFYGVSLVMFVLQCVGILVAFVACVVGRVLQWLCSGCAVFLSVVLVS